MTSKSEKWELPTGPNTLKLDDNNYLEWSRYVQSMLEAKNRWKVVEGTYMEPKAKMVNGKEVLPSEEEVTEWRVADRRSWGDLTRYCNPSDYSFYKKETAKELWDRLEKTKKPKGNTFYRTQIRAFTNYQQGLNETAEQAYIALRTIQADIQVITPESPIHDNLL